MSEKNFDNKNRFRIKTVGFRVSPEEWEHFETVVKLSGLSKQDYLINRILERDIVVQGNPRVYKALRDQPSVKNNTIIIPQKNPGLQRFADHFYGGTF